jgi:hypothetical protein
VTGHGTATVLQLTTDNMLNVRCLFDGSNLLDLRFSIPFYICIKYIDIYKYTEKIDLEYKMNSRVLVYIGRVW